MKYLFKYALIGCLLAGSGVVAVSAQKNVLPKFKAGTPYKTVRAKMIKAGWATYHSKDADTCMEGDERCQGRPEMEACSGTGAGYCTFLWKRNGKMVVIQTAGDDAEFDSIEWYHQ